ncbi:hypothetical protein FNH22_23395 [Fulvivirga sp. M361]|uniref:hypothetical protein n=1 Tax=Fulvivirga sp. M361 TaxID=2594266 RepID=UPI00117B2D1B|nr:hypothetical protein [Fulvivirga sp. M361]TRX51902.1 hypothetical protein FNH22_23395 [Fulvivirga sp. M361]
MRSIFTLNMVLILISSMNEFSQNLIVNGSCEREGTWKSKGDPLEHQYQNILGVVPVEGGVMPSWQTIKVINYSGKLILSDNFCGFP